MLGAISQLIWEWELNYCMRNALVLYIGSLLNLTTWFPCGKGKTLFILGELKLCGNDPVVNNSIYSNGDLELWHNDPKINRYNFWQQGRFRTITLVLYIGSLTNLATLSPGRRGRTLFILGSLGQRSQQ
jgi:hypothetical protein